MTPEEAKALLLEHVEPLPADQVWVAREVPRGFSFHAQAREYADTGTFSSQLVGQPIYLVSTSDRAVHEFPTKPDGYSAFEAAAGLSA